MVDGAASVKEISDYRKGMIVAAFVALLCAMNSAFWVQTASAAPAGGDQAKPAKVFATEGTLPLTLTAPWRDFMRNKTAKKPYPGTLEYVDEAGAKHSVPVTFEARGINRLKVCNLPPIKLTFEKDAVQGTPFRGTKSLKLVTHCGSGERWEQYVIKEMLAYRIYNLVTERSFKVHALSVSYVDSAERSTDGPHFGFLVEDDSALAKRNEVKKLDVPSVKLEQLEPLEYSRFALFEYLIGNTDFGFGSLHNVELIQMANGDYVPVVYDFDFSGAVNARYATVDPQFRIRSVRDRLYRGYCVPNEQYPKVFALFNAKKDSIYALYKDSLGTLLRPAIVDETLKYFDDFYRTINNPKSAENEIIDACVGKK